MREETKDARALLSALGTRELAGSLERLLAHGETGARTLLARLARGARLGPDGRVDRAVMEDLEHALVEIGRRHPDVFVRVTRRNPTLMRSFALVAALTTVTSDAATELLASLQKSRDGAIRWLVLNALVARQEPSAIARLGASLRDRDGLVVFSAATSLRAHGREADLPALLAVARAAKTPPGTRAAAWDAIESICARTGTPPPPDAPLPRLFEIVLPADAEVTVPLAQLVPKGSAVAKRGQTLVVSPHEGVVVGLDVREKKKRVLVLRR